MNSNNNNIEASYQLSPMQRGMLFHYQLAPGSGVDIEQMVCSFREDLNVSTFKTAWKRVVSRHQTLRTSFRWEGLEEPLQDVHSNVNLPFEVEDWQYSSPDTQQSKLEDFLKFDRKKGFNLAEAPLMRLTLFHLGPANYQLVWSFHHIIADGRSYPVILDEVFAVNDAICQGKDLCLQQTRPYGDYICWLQQQDTHKSERFWRNLLEGFKAPNSISLFQTGESVDDKDREYAECEIRISEPVTTLLRSLAKENQLTLNTFIQGAWALLLSRYSSEEDVVFGAVRAGRRWASEATEFMVGLFINTVPLRVGVPPKRSLIPWLKEIRQLQIAIREHENTPLVEIQGWSDVPRGIPLFESILEFDNYDLNAFLQSKGESWQNREFRLLEKTGYPITLHGYAGSALLLKIAYDTGRFDGGTIERMLGHLKSLLEGIAEDPNRSLSVLPILTDAERHQLLVEWNAPQVDYPRHKCLQELFEAQVERTPERVAVVFEGEELTYRELNRRANQLGHYLRRFGVGPEVLVGIFVDRSLEMVVGILGILKAGGAYVPLDLAYPEERLRFMVKDAQLAVIVTQERLMARLPADSAKIVCIDASPTSATEDVAADENPVCDAKPENLAYVIYTSGSTGRPKGVLITHGNVTRLFAATQPWYGFGPEDVWTLFHSHAFDFSVWEIWGALLYGGRLVVVSYEISRSPKEFYKLLSNHHVTVLNQTPSAFYQLIQVEESGAPEERLALRLVIFGGEALELQYLKPWFKRHGDKTPKLVNMYGITETTVHVTYRPITYRDVESGQGSVIGEPIPDLQLYVLDRSLQPVPIWVAGELYVGGAGLARGYLNRPELTMQCFIPDPFSKAPGARLYKTGDVARFLPNRDLEYLGRADQQVQIRGFRVELGEIESVLAEHEAISRAVVVVREDHPGGQRLVGYFVVTPDHEVNIPELRKHLRARLPEYMIPQYFVKLEAVPLTPNGKVDRRALPPPMSHRPELESDYVAPRTELERTIASIWQAVLHLEKIGINDNFFELGGHSLLATQVLSRIRKILHVEFPLKRFFGSPTIAGLSMLIEEILIKEIIDLPEEEAQRIIESVE